MGHRYRQGEDQPNHRDVASLGWKRKDYCPDVDPQDAGQDEGRRSAALLDAVPRHPWTGQVRVDHRAWAPAVEARQAWEPVERMRQRYRKTPAQHSAQISLFQNRQVSVLPRARLPLSLRAEHSASGQRVSLPAPQPWGRVLVQQSQALQPGPSGHSVHVPIGRPAVQAPRTTPSRTRHFLSDRREVPCW